MLLAAVGRFGDREMLLQQRVGGDDLQRLAAEEFFAHVKASKFRGSVIRCVGHERLCSGLAALVVLAVGEAAVAIQHLGQYVVRSGEIPELAFQIVERAGQVRRTLARPQPSQP